MADLEQIISFDDSHLNYANPDQNFRPDITPPPTDPNVDPPSTEPSTEPTEEPTPPEKIETPTDPPGEPEPSPTPPVKAEEPTEDEPDPIKNYYEFMVEQGLLLPNDGFEYKDSSSIQEAFEQTKTNLRHTTAQAMFNQLPEDFKPILEYAFKGGKNVKDFLDTYSNASLDLSNLDLDNTENQRLAVREYYKNTTKFSDEKIEILIDALSQKDALEEEATDAVIKLKDIQASNKAALIEQAELQSKAEREAEEKTRQEILAAIDATIPTERVNKVKGFIFSETNSMPKMDYILNSIFTNKEHLAHFADFLMDSYDPSKGFTIEDRYAKKATSKALNDFDKMLQTKLTDPKSKMKTGSVISSTKDQTPSLELLFSPEYNN